MARALLVKEEKKEYLNGKYAALHGSYWMTYCSVFAFISVFLVSRGFTAGSIGVLMAWANIMAALLQPWVASVADRNGRMNLKELMLLVGTLSFIPAGLLLVAPNIPIVTAILFMILMAAVNVLQPLINAVNGYYLKRGKAINFGVARGTGSFSYAVLSWLLGFLVTRIGPEVIPIAMVVLLLVMLAILTVFHMGHENKGQRKGRSEGYGACVAGIEQEDQETQEEQNDALPVNGRKRSGNAGFLKKYKMFFLLMAGIVLLFAFHNMVNTYLIQIMELFGGDSTDMGAAAALAAVCEIPVMLSFSRIVKKFRVNQLIRIAGAGFFLKALAVWIAHSVYMVYMSQLLQACSFALLIPATVYYADQMMEERDRVKGQAFITAAITAGGVVGNLLGGKLIDAAGVPVMLAVGVVFAAGGMVLLGVAAA